MRLLLSLILLVVFGNAQAKEPLIVIYDSGDTLSIEPYLPKRTQQKQSKKPIQPPIQMPITTPSMQPGSVSVTPKALEYLQRPLFLIGSDQRSKQWLVEKRQHLISIGAVGMLIEAKDLSEVKTILAIGDGLRLVPASAEGFASRLGLTHYPILLSKEGWEQ